MLCRAGIENAADALRGLSPSLVKQLLPIFDQLTPIYMDVAQGRQEFSPSPEETAQMLRNYYGRWSQGLEHSGTAHIHALGAAAGAFCCCGLCCPVCGHNCDSCLTVGLC